MIVQDILNLFKELLTDWINSILYFHAIYPEFIFDNIKTFNLIFPISKSPKLNEYISNFVDEITTIITQAKVVKFMVILHKNHQIFHQYTLEFSDIVDFSEKLESQVEVVDSNTIYDNFNRFLFYHLQHLKAIHSLHQDLEFKLYIESNVESNNEAWVFTGLDGIGMAKVLDEVSIGILNFNSVYGEG